MLIVTEWSMQVEKLTGGGLLMTRPLTYTRYYEKKIDYFGFAICQ